MVGSFSVQCVVMTILRGEQQRLVFCSISMLSCLPNTAALLLQFWGSALEAQDWVECRQL
jgi:hypothetical protein